MPRILHHTLCEKPWKQSSWCSVCAMSIYICYANESYNLECCSSPSPALPCLVWQNDFQILISRHSQAPRQLILAHFWHEDQAEKGQRMQKNGSSEHDDWQTGMKQPSRPGTSPTGKPGTISSESLGILASRSCNTIMHNLPKKILKACECVWNI